MADISVDDIPPPSSGFSVDDIPPPAKAVSIQPTFSVDEIPPPSIDLTKGGVPSSNTRSIELNPQGAPKVQLSDKDKQTLSAINSVQSDIDSGVSKLMRAGSAVGETLLYPFSVPAHMLAGQFERTTNVIEKASEIAGQSISLSKVPPTSEVIPELVQAYLSPQTIKTIRENDVKDQSGFATKALHEVVPPITLGFEVGGKEIEDVLKASGFGGLSPFLGKVTGLYLATLSDPAAAWSIGQKLSGVKRAAQEAETLGEFMSKESSIGKAPPPTPKQAEEVFLTQAQGWAKETEKGERALLQVYAPGGSAPLMTVKGAEIMDAAERSMMYLESKFPGLREYSQRSQFPGANSIGRGKQIEAGANGLYLNNEIKELSELPLTKKILQFTANREEFPGKYQELNEAMGIRLTPDEMETADRLTFLSYRIENQTNDAVRIAGKKIPEFQPAPIEDRASILAQTRKEMGLPRDPDFISYSVINRDKQGMLLKGPMVEVSTDGLELKINGTDYTFSEARGLGRRLSDEALQARQAAKKAETGLSRATQMSRFGRNPGALKEREQFSTIVQNLNKGDLYGVNEPYEKNIANVVLKNAQEKLNAASNIRYVDSMKSLYGRPAEEWPAYIEQMTALENDLRSRGKQVPRDVMLIARLNPETDLSSISDDAFKVYRAFNGEDQTVLATKNLLFPKDISSLVDSQLFKPDAKGIFKAAEWVGNQWAKNSLSSFDRMTRQGYENTIAYWSGRHDYSELLNAAADSYNRVRGKGDDIGKMFESSPLNESIFNFGKENKVKITLKDAIDPEAHSLSEDFYSLLHSAAKGGNLDGFINGYKESQVYQDMLSTYGKKAVDTFIATGRGIVNPPKKLIEFLNDNPYMNLLRSGGAWGDNLYKEGAYRTYIKRGLSHDEAVDRVLRDFMDFRTTRDGVRDLKWLNPFIAYNFKNVERTIPLLLSRPGQVNLANPYDGYLRKAIEGWSGWDPKDHRRFATMFPGFLGDMVLGPVLRGKVELANEHDSAKRWLSQYQSILVPENQQSSIKSPQTLFLNLQSNLSTALDFANPLKGDRNFFGPFVKAGLIMGLGYDPYKKKMMDYNDYEMGILDRVVRASEEVNPVKFKNLYNAVIVPGVQKLLPAYIEKLENGGLSPVTLKLMGDVFYGENAVQKRKLDRAVIQAVTNKGMLGLAYPEDIDIQMKLHINAQLQGRDRLIELADKALNSGAPRSQIERIKAEYKRISKDITDNAKAYNDYKARLKSAGIIHRDAGPLPELELKQDPETPHEGEQQ